MTRDIGEWLEGLGLEKYVEIFIENEIGFDALAHLSEDDLKQLGLRMGPRKSMIGSPKASIPPTSRTQGRFSTSSANVALWHKAEVRRLPGSGPLTGA